MLPGTYHTRTRNDRGEWYTSARTPCISPFWDYTNERNPGPKLLGNSVAQNKIGREYNPRLTFPYLRAQKKNYIYTRESPKWANIVPAKAVNILGQRAQAAVVTAAYAEVATGAVG